MLTVNHLAQAGDALHRVGRADLAADFWEAAIAASPDDPVLLTAAGVTYRAMKRPADAEASLRRAIAIEPSARRRVVLACSIHDQFRFDECEAEMRRARELDPSSADAAGLLGIWLLERWHWRDTSDDVLGEAIAQLERGIELAPDHCDFLSARLGALIAAERLEEVITEATRLLGRFPNMPELHLHRAAARMKLGDLAAGHMEFGDWAYKLPRVAGHPFHGYDRWWVEGGGWRVGNLESRHPPVFTRHPSPSTRHPSDVYVWNVEGAGDHFQFIRFAADMARDGWTVRAICNKTMDRLIARVPGVVSVVTEDKDIPEGATVATLPSLPAAYVGCVPLWRGPYLSADKAAVRRWRDRMNLLQPDWYAPFRVGLAWRGNPRQANDERRSFAFELLAPLLGGEWRVPGGGRGISFVSLQKGWRLENGAWRDKTDRSSALHPPPSTLHPLVADLGDDYEAGDWLDTAGVIANLDLVITPDTAIAHLAGAMGKPVWIALSEPCCWRWMGRTVEGGGWRVENGNGKGLSPATLHPSPATRSPWYPSARLFRQRVRGSWDGVFEAMAEELRSVRWPLERQMVSAASTPSGPPLLRGG